MKCEGCSNLVITPYAPWCDYEGTRKPLLVVGKCPKKKEEEKGKMKWRIEIVTKDNSTWTFEQTSEHNPWVECLSRYAQGEGLALPVNHDDGIFIVPYSEIKSIEVSEVKE